MIEFRFICRNPEDIYETVKGWFGREKKVHVKTLIHRPILQYRENGSEWYSVPFVVDREQWNEANYQNGAKDFIE